MEVSEFKAGKCYREGNDNIEEIGIHTNANIIIIHGSSIYYTTENTDYSMNAIDALREILHRAFHTIEYNGRASCANGSTPGNMTEEDMLQERIHYKLFYELRKGRANSNPLNRINSGSWHIVEQ